MIRIKAVDGQKRLIRLDITTNQNIKSKLINMEELQ